MTTNEFLTELKKAQTLPVEDEIHGLIRFYLSDNVSEGMCYCPITLVAKKMFGLEFEIGEWDQAAYKLGLDSSDAQKIVDASDNNLEYSPAELTHLRSQIQMAVLNPNDY